MATDALPPIPPPPPPPPPGGPTQDDKLWALLSHLSALLMVATAVGQLIAPLVIYLVYKDKSKFVAFHAIQSLYFQLAMIVVQVPVLLLTCGWGLLITGPISIIYPIVIGIKAYDGTLISYVVVGDMARRQVGI